MADHVYKIKRIPTSKKPGKILCEKGRILTPEEEQAAKILVKFGDNIKFLKESKQSHITTPDCFWRNEYWEIKTITKDSYNNTQHALSAASKQSENIILNACNTKRSINRIAHDVNNHMINKHGRKIAKVLIIQNNKHCSLFKKQ